MSSKIRQFGLFLVVLLGFGSLTGQGASASPLTVGSTNGTLYLTGDLDGGPHMFTTAGGAVTCYEADFAASVSVGTFGSVNELTLQPSFPSSGTNCNAFGFFTAHVKSNGCTYTFTTPDAVKAGEVRWTASTQFHLVCPTGKSIENTPTSFGVSVCTQFIGPQTPTASSVYGRNAGSSSFPMDVTLEYTISGIHYTGSGGVCGNSETHSDGITTATSTMRCYSDPGRTILTTCTFS